MRGFRASLCLGVFVVLLCACGPTRVQITKETDAVGLPRPSGVYVYDFAVHPSEVKLDPGGPLSRIRTQVLGGGDVDDDDQRAVDIGHQVSELLAAALVKKITAMGLPAQRANQATHSAS